MAANPDVAPKIITFCDERLPPNMNDCNAFLKAVGVDLGVVFNGNADQIVGALMTDVTWESVADGVAAGDSAAHGNFVVGGMRSGDSSTPQTHGHVVIVVKGALEFGNYPTAYWGSTDGYPADMPNGQPPGTINWSWKAADRDNVKYWRLFKDDWNLLVTP
jgi:hypothetical protein